MMQVWGGIIGSNGLVPGEESSDFYSAYYNDHVSSPLNLYAEIIESRVVCYLPYCIVISNLENCS